MFWLLFNNLVCVKKNALLKSTTGIFQPLLSVLLKNKFGRSKCRTSAFVLLWTLLSSACCMRQAHSCNTWLHGIPAMSPSTVFSCATNKLCISLWFFSECCVQLSALLLHWCTRSDHSNPFHQYRCCNSTSNHSTISLYKYFINRQMWWSKITLWRLLRLPFKAGVSNVRARV